MEIESCCQSHSEQILAPWEDDAAQSQDEDEKQLIKTENAGRPSSKSSSVSETKENDPEEVKTEELFKHFRGILNKMTPENFDPLMKRVADLDIDTEDRLRGITELTFEKAISEAKFSREYAKMCHELMSLKVQNPDGLEVDFRRLLLRRCQLEFKKNQDSDHVLKKKQEELEAASEEMKQQLMEELEVTKYRAKRNSLGNVKFIGELFKLKMMAPVIMHDCIVQLLQKADEDSLESLSTLLSTMGKDLDVESEKPRMDTYFSYIEEIVKKRQGSFRTCFLLEAVLDLRLNNWVPRHKVEILKTIGQVHEEAELEEQNVKMEESGGQEFLINGDGNGHTPPSFGGTNQPTYFKKVREIPPLDFSHQLMASNVKDNHWYEQQDKRLYNWQPNQHDDQEANQWDSKNNNQWNCLENKQLGYRWCDRREDQDYDQWQNQQDDIQPLSKGNFSQEDEEQNREREEGWTVDCPQEGSVNQLSSVELREQLDILIKDKATNQTILEWIEKNLSEQQISSNMFIRTLVTCICHSAIICGKHYKLDYKKISCRAKLLHRYMQDKEKQLQALYALQSLMVQLDHPKQLLRTIFHSIYDEDLISAETFYEWESSQDPNEQRGKDETLKSASNFFTLLQKPSFSSTHTPNGK